MQEAANYLRHILEVWHKIFEDKKTLMRLVRSQDVELLQLRAPGYSSHDSSVISKHFREGTIFPGIKKKDDRKRIWENLQSIECLIPSLFSFFADVKYLQAPAKILRQLCPPSRYSIREAMWRSFTGHGLPDNQWLLQTWEGDAHCRWIQGSSSNQFEFGYQHIWLYALRHWVEMVPECPKKEDGEETPIPYRPDPRRWYEIAKLAAKRGFESDQIDRLLSSDPDREVARQALFKARNPEYFKYDESAFDSYVAELSRIFKSAEEIPPDNLKPCFLTPGCGESLERRCGRVFNNAYKADRKYLFLEQLYQPIHGEASGVSSFAVRVSVYFAFFRRDYSTDTHIKSVKDRAHPPPSHADENGGNGTRPIIESQSGTQGQGLPVNALAIAPGTSGMQAMPSTSGTNYDCTKPGALMTSVSPGEPSTTNNPNADADDAVMAVSEIAPMGPICR